MQIETLKVFCDVVETGSFSAAAALNLITQSAVSQQLRALESRFQCKLLERGRGRTRPTPAGEVLYRNSRAILETYRNLEVELQELREVVAGTVRIAIVYSVGLHEFPPYLREFMRAYPRVQVHVEYSRANRIYEAVLSGTTDLGIVAYPPRHPQIVTLRFREDQLVLVAPPDHPLATAPRADVRQLDGEPFVHYERDIPTRRAIDQLFKAHGVRPRQVAEYDNIETIKRAVEIGQGLAMVPLPAVQRETEIGTLRVVVLDGVQLVRPLGIIYKRGRQLSPAARRFVEVLRQEKAEAAA
ncbi:MAG: transcriptional regulator [Candidatus Binatia bacterium]|nr:MAG: transcriptional regulator [Candidatus Binatia bacterium]